MKREWLLLKVLAAVAVSACGSVDPYVYNPGEFNRLAPNFGQEPADISQASVCYLGVTTSFDEVTAMAQERCQEFGKQAVYRENEHVTCPLLTPTRAIFDCVAKNPPQPAETLDRPAAAGTVAPPQLLPPNAASEGPPARVPLSP